MDEQAAALESLFQLAIHCCGRIATLETVIAGRETGGAFPNDSAPTQDAAVQHAQRLAERANAAISPPQSHG